MKKHFFTLFFVLTAVLSLQAEPFFVRVNGTTDYAAEATGEADYQGRTQYRALCVPLAAGDILTCYDKATGAAWAITAIDPYAAYADFDCTATGLVSQQAGNYNIYIKLKYEDDLWYVEQATDCSDPTEPTDPTDPENPDPTDPENPGDEVVYDSSVPAECTDIMFQAFYWDSNTDNGHGDTRWETLAAQASEIAAYFDLIWLPPSAKSSGGVGYHPAQYSNQNSAWGTRAELTSLISAFHQGGAKVIADIVINHAANQSSWCDFYPNHFGDYGSFFPDASWICKTDEVNTSSSGACKGAATGADDDGYGSEANYAAARDWDHNNPEVREMFRAYLQWMKTEMKYDGWRYDYCKGFHNSHIDDYNRAAANYFSVMEYWDGNANVLKNRLADANYNTLTFDFATKYAAFNNSLASFNYSGCKAPGLLGAGLSRYAVTFVDSHDTYQRDGNEFGGKGNSMTAALKARLLQCNAFMLSMPGIPCVFYPHWVTYKDEIAAMVLARRAAGIHSESPVTDEASATGYRATVTGKNGILILELGDRVASTPAGYTLAAHGEGYAIYIQTNHTAAPRLIVTPGTSTFKSASLAITMQAIGADNATIYYTTDGTDPLTSASRQTYTAQLVINQTTTLRAYAEANGVASAVQTFEYTHKESQTTPIIVSFYKPEHWDKVNLYAWKKQNPTPEEEPTNEILGKWPGTELTEVNANGFHYYQFDAAFKEVNFIFNAGSGKEQTSDLWTDEDVCYAWSSISAVEVLQPDCIYTSIEQVETDDAPALDPNAPMYNVLGQQVNASYSGIVIQSGYKYLLQ